MHYQAVLALLEQTAPDLSRSLARVEAFVSDWWQVPYLPWFTDHGPKHSRRVMEYLLAMIPEGLREGTDLSPVELYVACAAALAHDVGMQVLLERQAKLGELTAADYDAVRAEHPRQSFELILTKAGELGIPDDAQLVTAVGLVAQAHGTSFFSESVTKLRELQSVRNKPFRGELLAAMILMADELDLHYERARRPDPSQATLNTTSRAHYYKHHYITSVRLERTAVGSLEIDLDLTFPLSVSELERDAISRWVTTKLQTQIGLVHPYLLGGLGGQLRLSRAIRLMIKDEVAPVRHPIDAEALQVIEEDNLSSQIIDYQRQRRSLLEALHSRRVAGVLGRSGDDPDGREDILDWLRVKLSRRNRIVASERLRNCRGGSASDVLAEWLASLGHIPKQWSSEAQQRRGSLDALLDHGNEVHRVAFFASSLDALRGSDKDWMLNRCMPRLLAAFPDSVFAFTSDLETLWSAAGVEAYLLRLGTPDAEEVAEYFRRFEDGSQGKIYLGAGVDYGTLRRLAIGHELVLAEVSPR